jgi:hypothetical protein
MEQYFEFKFSWAYNQAGYIRRRVFDKSDEEIQSFFDIRDAEFQKQIMYPQKHTVLHSLIEHMVNEDVDYITRKCDYDAVAKDWAEQLNDYGVQHMTEVDFDKNKETDKNFDNEHHSYAHYLAEIVKSKTTQRIADETFQLLFGDREFCKNLNLLIAEEIQGYGTTDYSDLYEDEGKLKRQKYFPVWVEKAVYLRDRGNCAVCLTDLSGLIKTGYKDAIDHIVPLNLGGINDITNFQLICEKCNLAKLGHTVRTSEMYSKYF